LFSPATQSGFGSQKSRLLYSKIKFLQEKSFRHLLIGEFCPKITLQSLDETFQRLDKTLQGRGIEEFCLAIEEFCRDIIE